MTLYGGSLEIQGLGDLGLKGTHAAVILIADKRVPIIRSAGIKGE